MATASLAGCAALVAAAGLIGMVTRSAAPAGIENLAAARNRSEVRDIPIPAVRLQDLSAGAAANPSRRNPFAFRAAPAPPAAGPRLSSLRPTVAPVIGLAAGPAIILAGIAERQTPEGIARTALVIVGDGELTMATIGESIAPDLSVDEIGPDRVVVVDRVRKTRLTVLLGPPEP